ncbi:DUF2335 domain-containing protein [Fructobacillus sp. M2-14]|uniref:DUF2335 domain-containing protein n=1 Tax=Fructobacillus broussonetiae TaxID=2713173 RepID=A0ABS5R332_9LACO|nr:DUF2335 domain-containing protein [Fructobacillus broussonetiae]MBS9338969.1 DUF2335 domain-containing protein [Fructobacillus broussonetiae]
MEEKNKSFSDYAVSKNLYLGPIPPANELDYYRQIDASLPKKIMRMSERQSDHRMEQSSRALDIREQELALAKLGIVCGCLLLNFALIAAFFMIYKVQYTGGVFSIFGVLCAVVTTWFTMARKKN